MSTASAHPLFAPFQQRDVTVSNRIVVSPMCQYSCEDGLANDWHLVHLGARAVGGAGLVFTEACAVTPEGRISPQDLGLWLDAHVDPLARVTRFLHGQGAVAGIQLAHAGRKASVAPPWKGGRGVAPGDGGWQPLAPGALAFDEHSPAPAAMTTAQIDEAIAAFARAAERARHAGFRVLELHGAHGYLLHQFLSPLSNPRTDEYGGSLENRARFVCRVVAAVRRVWPESLPLWLRLSATDWVADGRPSWDPDQTVALARMVKPLGVDLIDVSSGGLVPGVKIPVAPGYQVPFAARVRREAQIATGAVGMISEPRQAEEILREGQADVVLLAREFLRQPNWPLVAGHELGADVTWPVQYDRAKPR